MATTTNTPIPVSPKNSFFGYEARIALWEDIKDPLKTTFSGLVGMVTFFVTPLDPALAAAIAMIASGISAGLLNTLDFYFSQVKLR